MTELLVGLAVGAWMLVTAYHLIDAKAKVLGRLDRLSGALLKNPYGPTYTDQYDVFLKQVPMCDVRQDTHLCDFQVGDYIHVPAQTLKISGNVGNRPIIDGHEWPLLRLAWLDAKLVKAMREGGK